VLFLHKFLLADVLFSAQSDRILGDLATFPSRTGFCSAYRSTLAQPTLDWTAVPQRFQDFHRQKDSMDNVPIRGPPWILERLLARGVPAFTGRTCCVCQGSPVLQPHPELRLLWECDDQEYCIKCWFAFWVEREHDCQHAVYNPGVRPMDDAAVLALQVLTTNLRNDWSCALRLKALFFHMNFAGPGRNSTPPWQMQSAQPKLDWTAVLQRLQDANPDRGVFFFIGTPWMLECLMLWGVPTYSGRTCAQCGRTPLLQPDDDKFVRAHDEDEFCILCWMRFWTDKGYDCQDVVFIPNVDPLAIPIAELLAEELRSVPTDAWPSVLWMCAELLPYIQPPSWGQTRPTICTETMQGCRERT